MMLVCILLTLGIYSEISGLIMPMTKQDGTVDMSSVMSHITLLEQTVSGFQTKTAQLELKIQASKTDLQVTKSDLQSTKSELQTVKADLKNQQRHSDVEVTSLKDELAAVKSELIMTSDELISVKSDVATLKSGYLSLQASINQTILDSISHDVKSNMADIKSVEDALEMTNSSLESFVTHISYFNRNTTVAVTELQRKQIEAKSELSKQFATLTQIQSNITSAASDVARVKDNVMVVESGLITTISDINLIRSEVAGIRGNVSGLVATSASVTHISQMLQATNAELQSTKSSLQDQKQQSTSMHNSFNRQLQTIRSDLALKTQTVAFSARESSSPISSQPVKFSTVEYNSGYGYSSSTGKFTAPVSGTYVFSTQIEMYDTGHHQEGYLYIKKAGSTIATGYGESSPGSSPSIDDVTIPVTVVTHVSQGQQVWIESQPIKVYSSSSQFVGALVSVS